MTKNGMRVESQGEHVWFQPYGRAVLDFEYNWKTGNHGKVEVYMWDGTDDGREITFDLSRKEVTALRDMLIESAREMGIDDAE